MVERKRLHDPDRLEGLRRDARFYTNNFGRYRPILTRSWGLHQNTAVIIGLNPSKADGLQDDPTIRADYGFCHEWDCEHLIKLNLFDFCATEPKDMMACPQPEGNLNFEAFQEVFEKPKSKLLVVAAWGAHGTYLGQDWALLQWLEYWGIKPMCLGTTANGCPRHPLYVKRDTKLRPYVW